MKNTRNLFHLLSYVQYPLMLVVLYYYVVVIISLGTSEPNWAALNNALIFLGIMVGFSTLQDTTKTQNKISLKIWQNPIKGKFVLWVLSIVILIFLISGLIGFFSSRESIHKEISFGLIVLGIGLLGMLKSTIEMFENHRSDKSDPKK